jgi:hypothetical protein
MLFTGEPKPKSSSAKRQCGQRSFFPIRGY